MSDRVRAASGAVVPRLLRAVMIGLALLSPACGDGPTRPPSAGPFTQCPADLQIDSPDGGAVPVNYGLPGASGGTPPYTIVCEPVSGTSFGPGTHTITCRVTDAAGRGALCTFSVRVVPPPRLSLTRFLAFGDSITEGQVGNASTFGPRVVDIDAAYPTRLQDLLRGRYRAQSIGVTNEGCGGELTSLPSSHCAGGEVRLPGTIVSSGAEVLLLMEGTNDLARPDPAAASEEAIDALRNMVAYARSSGMAVFIATIPPMIEGGPKDIKASTVAQVPIFNNAIRTLAAGERAVLVDVYAALRDRLDLIGPDNVHPTRAGQELIAQTFFDAIRANLEASSGSELR